MTEETTTLKISRVDTVTSEYTVVRRKSDGAIITVFLSDREFDFNGQTWVGDTTDEQEDQIDERIYDLQEAEGKQ